MKTVSMLELRQNAQAIVEKVERGQPFLLTYRGRPVARIEPVETSAEKDDPFYSLGELADHNGKSLTNREIDEALYGE